MASKSRKRRERRKKLKNKQYSKDLEIIKYDHLSNDELISLISGYIRNTNTLLSQVIPLEIIACISCYHWSKLYDDFNLFRFKSNIKSNEIKQNFFCLKYYVMPLHELKTKYLLPFDEIIYDSNNNKKVGKYSSFKSQHCAEFIQQKDCMIHQVNLDKNDENIYHLMDSFVVNKFIDLFEYNKPSNHWESEKKLPGGKGPHRAGFRCVGHKKQSDMTYFNQKIKYRKLWKFIGGNFDILILNQNDFVKKCLLEKFDIKLNFNEKDKVDRDKLKMYTKISSINMNNNELICLLYDAFKQYASAGMVKLDDFIWKFSNIQLDYLTCKEIVCDLLYNEMKDKLNENHWVINKLVECRKKLNIDQKIKHAKKIEQKKKLKKKTEIKKEEDKEKESDAYKGNWTSWSEIKVNNNNVLEDVYPFLMTDIMFSTNYSYGLNSLGGMDYNDWTLQRPLFGTNFLQLFSKNSKNHNIRAFWCRHIAWDMFDEDYLSADKILCCIDNEKIVAVWSLIVRLYG